MVFTVTVVDETTSGERVGTFTLDFLTERVTVRELIRSRVYQEVSEHNARNSLGFLRLTGQADDVGAQGSGPTGRKPHLVDWEVQYERAVSAFMRNGFLLLVDDRQMIDLDAEVEIRHNSVVTFLKLLPLVGG